MRWTRSRIWILGPQGRSSPALVVGAGRAGGLGILDLSRQTDPLNPLVLSSSIADHPFALRVSPVQALNLDLAEAPETLELVLLTGVREERLLEAIDHIHANNRSGIIEVRSSTEARDAVHAGCDGLVVVGNEAGGLVGSQSTFILLQAVLAQTDRPVWVRGGIGPRVAAGCIAAGAAGVVLEGAALLARETALDDSVQVAIERCDGTESLEIGPSAGPWIRITATPGSILIDRLRHAAATSNPDWYRDLQPNLGWESGQAWPVGQDAALAAVLARRYVTIGGIIQAFEQAISDGITGALRARPMDAGSALAASHGTRFPIVQGPMTRVSDTPSFAEAVSREGALPLVALALLRGPEARSLLTETARRCEGRAWGVGLLGFAPADLRKEQLEAIRAARPPWALIAGGRPDQAAALEEDGISTYLHVPSPELLEQFLRTGARRFVIEGRECGGHVGPRSSFVLWDQACAIIQSAIASNVDPESVHLLFAGGIHDARSAAAVAAISGDLARQGVKIGILMGTAYLFTREAVESGAIVEGFQQAAIQCRETVLLETGPGHQVRVSPSPFVDQFQQHRQQLLKLGKARAELREELERLNVGRLRLAAKGVKRAEDRVSPLEQVEPNEQARSGLYMLGQLAALRDQVTTLRTLHESVSIEATEWLQSFDATIEAPRPTQPPSEPIAIVGMAALLPGARDVQEFWANSLIGKDAIVEVPPEFWDWRKYYDPDPKAPDRIISKWGGFVPEIPFDPLQYGMPPTSVPSIEPAQLLALEVTRAALADAGYAERPFPRERTAVVLGMGGGAAQLAMGYAFRSYLPMLDDLEPGAGTRALDQCKGLLPEWTEDSFAGFLLNVTAGRIANRFDFGGANYTVDAACGSSLAALSLAVRELRSQAADMVVLGGVDTVQNPFTYLAFSKTQAFSHRGRCRPFDSQADGIVISEGVAMVVLKRLKDAQRDGDRVYAVIRGVGASSDGRCRGLTAPRVEGQIRALKRAYEDAGVDPTTVGYVEAHGTGTAVGDVAEVEALTHLMQRPSGASDSCVVGSVKSQIGHTKCAAGLAGLIHAALALHHHVLPPTIGIERPNPKLDLKNGPIQLNTTARPWLHQQPNTPRRAGVSAFGFGGTNFHAVLEAHDRGLEDRANPTLQDWPVELLVWRADSPEKLRKELEGLRRGLADGADVPLRDLAHSLNRREPGNLERPTLAIIASGQEDLVARLDLAIDALSQAHQPWNDPRGIWYAARPQFVGQPVAFLFPGQGSQSVNMLRELAVHFSEVRSSIEQFDTFYQTRGEPLLSPTIYPPPAFEPQEKQLQETALRETDVAQPALGAACVGVARLLAALGIEPAAAAGHSYGELTALHWAGAIDLPGLAELSLARGRIMRDLAGENPGAMAALQGGPEEVASLLEAEPAVVAVNENGPRQTVVAGPEDRVQHVLDQAEAHGIRGRRLSVACAFHTSQFEKAVPPFVEIARRCITHPPRFPVYSNLDASPHPADPNTVAQRLGDHLARPVRFSSMVHRMHADGARVFVEVGPGGVLTPLVGSILGDTPHLAIATESTGRPGIIGLLHLCAQLVVAGVPVRLQRLTQGRSRARLDLDQLSLEASNRRPSPSTWMVNGSRARPLDAPEPRRLGQAGITPPPAPTVPSNPETRAHNATAEKASISPSSRPASNAAPNGNVSMSQSDRVMAAFQENMRKFLELQQATMTAYLSGAVSTPPSESPAHPTQPRPSAIETETSESDQHFASAIVSRPDPPASSATPTPEVASIQEREHRPPSSAANRDTIANRLLDIVRDRTGYPREVLGMDLDIEADLGIDSIKRVEILGKLRDAFPMSNGVSEADAMEALTRGKTLGAIADLVFKFSGNASISSSPPPAPSDTAPAKTSSVGLRRLTLEAVDTPLPEATAGLMPGGLVLITRDEHGLADALARQLRANELKPILIGGPQDPIDWRSPAAINARLAEARKQGSIVALVHLAPLHRDTTTPPNSDSWKDRLDRETHGLFLLARAAAPDLERSAQLGGACLMAATSMGGTFASNGHVNPNFFPGHGAVAGLVKTLAREWKDVRCRVVDLDLDEPRSELVARLAAELHFGDGWTEVGYDYGRRIRLQTHAAPIDAHPPRVVLDPGEPIMISGGARGITALAAIELAKRWKPTLLLMGRSPLLDQPEPPQLASLSDPAQLRAALLDQLRRDGKDVTPQLLESTFRAFVQAREIRGNLAEIRRLGSVVEYASIDVRDRSAVDRVTQDWRNRFGDPVGLIHGAGMIRDKLLRDKSPESFDDVLSTKLDGALNLIRGLKPNPLRFTVFFSSISGRFGNRGQSDYAAANEALSKLALWIDRRWPGRVVSIIWGPWADVGMVSDLQDVLGSQGLGMIAPQVGVAAMIDELERGQKGEVEVILAAELGSLENPIVVRRSLEAAAR